MITREEALIRAEQLLDAEVRPWMDDEVVIDTSATLQAGTSWVFFYNSRIFLETRSTWSIDIPGLTVEQANRIGKSHLMMPSGRDHPPTRPCSW